LELDVNWAVDSPVTVDSVVHHFEFCRHGTKLLHPISSSPRLECPNRPSGSVRGVRNAPDRTGRLDGWFQGNPKYCPGDNLKYSMDNPPGHPRQIPDVSGTWPNSFFFGSGGTKPLSTDNTPLNRTKIEGSLTFHNFMYVLDSQAFRTNYFCLQLIFRIFLDFLFVECHEWNRNSKWSMWKVCIAL